MMRQCDWIRENITAYQSGEINAQERADIAAHLPACSACRRVAAEQAEMRKLLHLLKKETRQENPPSYIWDNILRAIKQIDLSRRRRLEIRMALVACAMLLFAFGAVWARLNATFEFPTGLALRDFRRVEKGHVVPEYRTADADAAARWLRERLGTNTPSLPLTLSRAELIGADSISLGSHQIGRLIYRTARGWAAVYVVPGGIAFPAASDRKIAGQNFQVDGSAKDVGLFGWQHKGVGYGLVASQPLRDQSTFALEAQHDTDDSVRQ